MLGAGSCPGICDIYPAATTGYRNPGLAWAPRDADLVPFEKYAKAAEGLANPSSVARALFGGAEYIERIDCLVRRIADQ
jgi:hypothetical protein